MADLIDYANIVLGIAFTAAAGFALHSGDVTGTLIAAGWGLGNLFLYINTLYSKNRELRSTISHLEEEQYVDTIDIIQLAKSDGEIELQVTPE